MLKEVARGIGTLPTEQREALLMVVLHGMGYEEIAEATGCAIGTAKSRVFRARNALHAMLVGEKGQRQADRSSHARQNTRRRVVDSTGQPAGTAVTMATRSTSHSEAARSAS